MIELWAAWWAEYFRALQYGPHTMRTALLRHHVGDLRLVRES